MKFLKHLFFAFATFSLAISAAYAGEKGTADDAVALVKKAAAYLRANGPDKAFAEFNNPKGQFINGDLYVFVQDKDGKMMAHGTNPKLIGKNLIDIKDADGKLFGKELVELAKTKGSGWVDYKWPNPMTKIIEPKATYVEMVGDVLIACGIYK